jgi:DNA-binding transcriptional ArsR family regulator
MCFDIILYMQRNMSETNYRASRFCRVLGNPTAYEILKILVQSERTPTDLAIDVGLSVKTVSETLRNLRQINLVRYTTRKNRKVYFLKDRLLLKVLQYIEKYVERMRVQK